MQSGGCSACRRSVSDLANVLWVIANASFDRQSQFALAPQMDGGSGRGPHGRQGLPFEQRGKSTIAEVFADALLPDVGNSFVEYMPVSDDLALRVKAETGTDISGFKHVLDEDHIRHVREFHGPHGKADRGVPDGTRGLLAQIVEEADTISAVPPDPADQADSGGLLFRKKVGGGEWLIATQLRTKRRHLALKTLKLARKSGRARSPAAVLLRGPEALRSNRPG